MVCKLHKQYVHPLARIIRGVPISWGPNSATMKHSDIAGMVGWSSCSRFVAVDLPESTEVLDAVTLERLYTFTHPFSWNGWPSFSPGGRSLTRINDDNSKSITWDLQTGGRISATPPTPNAYPSRYFSSTYSTDGKIVAVACKDSKNNAITSISTYNLISGTRIYSHRVLEGRIIAQIWTHGESLRFATVKPGIITIWEVEFTSKHTLAKIKSLPAPNDTDSGNHLFLPILSRLAFILREAVLIWDARDSKFLLNFVGGGQFQGLSFSYDGCYFACRVAGQGIHLWKESPTGYVLHQKLVSGPTANRITPFLSPDGESIIISKLYETQLRRTTDPISPPSGVPLQPAEQSDFVLAFSPDRSFIATGRLGGNIATIVDLKSGDTRLVVNTSMKICGLGVTGSTVIIVGEGKIVTWNLPVGSCVLGAMANIHDSVRTIVFNHPPPFPGQLHHASISPDFNHFVITGRWDNGLDIYDMSTGKRLVGTTPLLTQPRFTRDGREVWDSNVFFLNGWRIMRGEESDIIGLEPVGDGDGPSGGHPWESPHGHNIADDGWILDSRNKRVMWLPHHWRVARGYRVWDGRFLALFDPRLPEPVILELCE